MIRVDEVRLRIEDRVPELAGVMGYAAQFAPLVEQGLVPQRDLSGFVLPGGMTGGRMLDAAGMTIQPFVERVMVVLALRTSGDPLDPGALDQMAPLVRAVIAAVVGWAPADDVPGVFAFERHEAVGSIKGVLIHQIDFTLQDQLRIAA